MTLSRQGSSENPEPPPMYQTPTVISQHPPPQTSYIMATTGQPMPPPSGYQPATGHPHPQPPPPPPSQQVMQAPPPPQGYMQPPPPPQQVTLAQGVREMECLNCGAYWNCQDQVLPSCYCCVPLCSYCLILLVFRFKCRTILLVSIPAQASSTGYPSQCLTRCLILPSAHKPYLNPHSRQVSTLSSGVLTLGVNWPW